MRENADGDVSREYLSLESRFGGGGRWSLFERAELDLNTGWRQEVTGKSYQLSNVSLSGNLRLASSTWAFVSYDGRRNYRYYQNRLLPPEQFDDLLHQGLRAGLNYSRPGGFGATAGFGMSLKQPDPRYPELDIANAYSFNAGVRHANLFSSGFSAGLDGAGFSNGYTDGGVLSRPGRPELRARLPPGPVPRPLVLPRPADRAEPQHPVAAGHGPRGDGPPPLLPGELRVRRRGRPAGAPRLPRAGVPVLSTRMSAELADLGRLLRGRGRDRAALPPRVPHAAGTTDRSRKEEAVRLGVDRPPAQFPFIDPMRCIGCGTCVDACPEGDVLGIVGGTATVVNGLRCVGHGRCEIACPVGAIEVGLGDLKSRKDIPILDPWQQTTVPGLFIAGELGGLALVKNAIGQARKVVERVAQLAPASRTGRRRTSST